MYQLDAFVRHAEDRVRHLRQRRLKPLAMAVRADRAVPARHRA